jgi:RNA polymerase sigma-70 factor, ECF subfamily
VDQPIEHVDPLRAKRVDRILEPSDATRDTSRMGSRSTPTAGADERAEFDALARKLRPEIQLHCYRMLGSLHDAEDAAQDAFLRAWRGRAGLRDRDAFRACLRALARRGNASRVLSETQSGAWSFAPLGAADPETSWLEPYPDALVGDLPERTAGPEARYEWHETIQLAFLAAIQELPPRQRAALLLRDALGMTATETAAILETSVAAANSAVERARAAMTSGASTRRAASARRPGDLVDADRRLLDRYVRAWEAADVDGLVGLLREDALWTMPPWREWYAGAPEIARFLRWVWRPGRNVGERLVSTSANGAPAFGYYRSEPGERVCRPFAIQVLGLDADRIASIVNFVDVSLFPAFGLPDEVPQRPGD